MKLTTNIGLKRPIIMMLQPVFGILTIKSRFAEALRQTIIICLLAVFVTTLTLAQDTSYVEGIVLVKSNVPMADVTVSIEGSVQMPSITDESGKFSLATTTGNEWIIISPTSGYKKKRIYLNNKDHLTIYLTPDNVSSGYDEINLLSQTINKRNVISSYSDLNTQNVHHEPGLTIDEFMEGKVPGLNVISRSGIPASGASVNVRGINTLNSSSQPLYVIDGIPLLPHGVFGSNLNGYSYNPLLAVSPLDISKMNIVRDPTINAAYGSKGSNGIVFIETLDPSVTQTTIEFDVRGGYSLAPSTLIPQLNAEQHKTLMNELLFTSPLLEEQVREQYPNLYLESDDDRYIDYQHNTFWQDLIYNDSYFTNFNLKVKGGDEIARYGLSFGYLNSDGIIKSTAYQGYNLRFVSRLNIFKWLKMNAGVALNYSTSELKEAGTVDETSPILTSLAKSPLLNPYQYDLEGRELTILSEVDELGTSNPVAVIENYSAENSNYNFISTLNFESTITKNLSVNSAFSLAYNVLKEQLFMPNHGMELYYNQEAINVAKVTNNNITSFYNNTYIKFNKTINNIHNLSSNTGMNVYTNSYEMDWGLTKNAHENDEYRSLQDGQDNLRELGGQTRSWNWITIYENLHYSYKDKYLVSAGISLDGSSRVGENAANTMSIAGEPFGLFYGGGIGWRLSSEPFLKNISWLEELKLRVSMGKTGNDDIGEASATNYYQAVKFRETVGLYPAVVYNDKLTYETVTQMNSGIDLSLWGSRISAHFDYFMSEVDNMLIFKPIDPYLGYSVRKENGGKMENNGWELNTFIRLVDGSAFKWDVQTFLTKVNNEVTQVPGSQLTSDILGGQLINTPGAPANSYYGFVYEGVYSSQQEANEAGLVNDKGFSFQAGDAKFRDISGSDGTPDGIINNLDKAIIGSSMPEYFGGISNAFSYKRWTLSGFVQFVYGNELFNYIRYKNEQMTDLSNQSTNTLNRWQYNGHETNVPRALWNDPMGNAAFSTRWIEDGSYVRIKNISLSYKIPNQFLAFKNAEFYVSAHNMYILSDYLGYDPEFSYSFSNINQGVDYGQTPQPRQFIAGLKLGL